MVLLLEEEAVMMRKDEEVGLVREREKRLLLLLGVQEVNNVVLNLGRREKGEMQSWGEWEESNWKEAIDDDAMPIHSYFSLLFIF